MNAAVPAERLYRLIPAGDWKAALESGSVSYCDRDRRDGFLHMSTEKQVLETARRYFGEQMDVLALEVDFDEVARHVRFEKAPGRDEAFPHLYGDLPVQAVRRARRLIWTGAGFAFGDDA